MNKTLGLLVFGLLTCLLQAEKAPNILFMFADDLGRYASAYANPARPSPSDITNTPAFDRLAKEGAIFQNAFVSAPSCTPSRAAVYTGRHFFRNGASSQLHSPWDPKPVLQGKVASTGSENPFEKLVGMPNTLAANGYHIGWSHKWHLRESLIGGKKNHYAGHGARISSYSEEMTKAGDKPATKASILADVRGNFTDFLDKRAPGQAFFYSFNPTNTHRSWVRGSGKALWGINPEDLKGRLPAFLPDVPEIREDFADYLGEGMAFDAACATLIDELEKRGELDNTLVVVSGDHGAPGFPRGKCNVHDFGAGVLLAMRWPKHIAAGRNVTVPVSLTDLAPTFLAAAGLKSTDEPNGQNLLPALAQGSADSALRGWALIGRETHVGEARADSLPYPVRALRTPEFLYVINFKPDRWPMGDPKNLNPGTNPDHKAVEQGTHFTLADIDASPTKAWLVDHREDKGMQRFIDFAWNKRPAEELYDLAKDPDQLQNVAADPAYAEIREKLRKALMEELSANHDPRLDNDAFDRAPYLSRKVKGER